MPAPNRMFESRFPARTPESNRPSGGSRPAWLFVVACLFNLVLTGCAARQDRIPSKPFSPRPPSIASALPVPITPVEPNPALVIEQPSPARSSAVPPKSRPSNLAVVSEKLSTSFDVVPESPDSLRVSKKNPAPVAAPSLFEESILLGKIRGVLAPASSRSSRPASFKNGVASFTIAPNTSPGAAALAIAKILALDGVNEVRAVFPSE